MKFSPTVSQSSWQTKSNYLYFTMFDGVIIWPFSRRESEEDRRKYIIKVFLEFGGFLLIGIVHWILMLTLLHDWFLDMVKDNLPALILAFVMGMFLLAIFSVSTQLRKISCINWIITLVIVECVVFSLSLLIVSSGILYMLAGFLIVSLVFVMCTIIAVFMTPDLTEAGLYLYILATGAYVMSLYSLLFYAVLGMTWGFYAFATLIACIVLLFLMYHVQTITGGRVLSEGLYDDKLAALLLFHEFIGLFVLTLYWRPIMQRLQLKE
ncbi:uncharacterized protein LOC108108103 [Drosophila eugracilis]|uniref:uncharacterized protein LOC108108103 n=1 Tax=Drosophila eugracilis TaxID=29029 RepID=UPI0007E797B9|nr:uncharacterized protein LOC108108103 [Drosophila eugracilis]